MLKNLFSELYWLSLFNHQVSDDWFLTNNIKGFQNT